MGQMMELILAKMDSFQEKVDAYQEEMKATLDACLEKTEV
jgi:hypothetical protein